MGNKTVTQEDVRKAWSEKVGKVDQYDLHEIETADGGSQTQLIDKDTGSITVAVNGTGSKVLQTLFDHAGDTFIDGGESPLSATGNQSVKRYTSRGVLATPTQPEVMVATQEPVEVNTKGENRSEAQAPVDRQASTGSVQLTGDGGEKPFKEAKSTTVPTQEDDEEDEEVLPEDNPNAKLVELNERATELGVEGGGDFKKKDDAREAIKSHQAEQE